MYPIQMVDTRRQYNKIKEEVDAAIHGVLDSSMFIGGPVVQNFATNLARYNGSKHVIPCANGTDALQIAMMALDLQPGDEVITPSFTYIATVEVVALLRLKPVFAEVEPNTFCIDPESIRKLITPKTKAIVPVHLYGHPARMEEIMRIAEEFNLYVIEDNAQAIGSNYIFDDSSVKKTGSIGTIGCTSFYPSKNLGAFGDGGAIFTDDDRLADKLRMIASHGQSKRYQHDLVGCNSRLDAVQAAVLDVKLKHLDEYIRARRKAADFYDAAFANVKSITTPFRAAYGSHVFHQYTLLLDGIDRDKLSEHLASKNIPSMIYYPIPSHKQQMFASFGGASFDLPVTDWLTERVISLPIHTELDEEQLEYIASTVLKFINQ
jgi:dTDP-4-amino-4,6-dideoxygalactose transaminase